MLLYRLQQSDVFYIIGVWELNLETYLDVSIAIAAIDVLNEKRQSLFLDIENDL